MLFHMVLKSFYTFFPRKVYHIFITLKYLEGTVHLKINAFLKAIGYASWRCR